MEGRDLVGEAEAGRCEGGREMLCWRAAAAAPAAPAAVAFDGAGGGAHADSASDR